MAERGGWRSFSFFWLFSAVLFMFLYYMAAWSPGKFPSPRSGPLISYSDRRSKLYNRMARDLDEHGAAFLKGGKTSQSLSISDIFELKEDGIAPVLKAAEPPVRAIILHLDSRFSVALFEKVAAVFLPYFEKAIWFQNTSLYHFSMFHASHHLEPVLATENEIEMESKAVKAVAESLSPMTIVLDQAVLTSTGVLLGCWQVISGPDPLAIRAKMKDALPYSPESQFYDPVMLHTSFARILGRPHAFPKETQKTYSEMTALHELVKNLNGLISGFQATVSELWFVEEYDVLALALSGRMRIQRFPMGYTTTDLTRYAYP